MSARSPSRPVSGFPILCGRSGEPGAFAIIHTEVTVWFRKKKPNPTDVVRELRDRAFSRSVVECGIDPAHSAGEVWVLLMETGYPEAVATLVCVADGTTSLYFSNGGGMIGAGQHGAVRAAAAAFRAAAIRDMAHLMLAQNHPPPPVGHVRFYARLNEGLRAADVLEETLGGGGHPLSPLFFAGQAVITAIRETGVGQ